MSAMDTQGKASRLILQIRWGLQSFQKAVLHPGQTLQVGRDDAAGMRVLHDEFISPLHFELRWDGKICRLLDLNSALGTWLDGKPVLDAEASHGSWVRAGRTDFSLYQEGATPDTPILVSAELAAAKERALALLNQQETPLFAVLDAARDERILPLLREHVDNCRSLYEGTQGDVLAEVAPYLVHFSANSNLLEELLEKGWGQSWGVYLNCELPFVEVRRHLRKFLMVQVEDSTEHLYLRYYDPRVLKTFLETSAEEQIHKFIGPLDRYIFETQDGTLLQFKRSV